MISKKATVIISVCVGIAVVAGGLFGIYKHFVTPERIVALSLINAKHDAEKTIGYFDDNEADIIENILKSSGRVSADFTISDSVVLDGANISVEHNSSKSKTSLTEIKVNDLMKLDVYSDSERILVNTPLFNGGFEIPTADFSEKWNSSIFKDIAEIPTDYSMSGIASGFITGRYSADEFETLYGERIQSEIMQIQDKNPVKQSGTAAVMVENKTKKAKVYTAKIEKQEAESLLVDIAADYIGNKDGEISEDKAEQIKNLFEGYADDYELSFKIDNLTLREIELKDSNDETFTVAFEGEDNPLDIIVCYKNGDIKNSVRRVHGSNAGEYYEKIYFGENGSFSFEEGTSMLKADLSISDFEVTLNAYGKTVTEDTISFNNAELDLNGLCTLSGNFSVSDEHEDDLVFEKSGQYVNLLEIGQDEWEAISDMLLTGIDLLS